MAKKILALVLAILMILPLVVACNSDTDSTKKTTTGTTAGKQDENNNQNNQNNQNNNQNNQNNNENNGGDTEIEEDPFKDGKLSINGNDISEYVIVIAADPINSVKYFAEDLAEWIKDITGKTVNIVDDTTAPTAKEIVIGETNRPESTEAIGSGFSQTWHYNVVLNNDKLAIAIDGKGAMTNALNALQRAFANNACNITKGFTNTIVALEDVKDLVMGAVRKDILSDGLHVHKTTQAQIDAWHEHTKNWSGNKENPRSATGIRLDFDTDSSYIRLKLSKTTSSMVLLLNDELVINGYDGSYWQLPESALGKTNRITILMTNVGYTDEWAITELEVDGGAKAVRHKTDLNILFLGDSITEGYNNHGHPASTYTFYTHTFFNAEAVVQGHGGSQLWPDMVDPAMANLYQPDVIIIAMGTNDYSGNSGQSVEWFKDRMNTFLNKVEQVYPNVPIIGITPIRRLSSMSETVDPENNYDKNCVAKANAGYAQALREHNAFVVNGENILSKAEHYADTVHPNEKGFIVYGETLSFLIELEIQDIVKNKKK